MSRNPFRGIVISPIIYIHTESYLRVWHVTYSTLMYPPIVCRFYFCFFGGLRFSLVGNDFLLREFLLLVARGFFRFLFWNELLSCFGTCLSHPISIGELYMLEFASLVECDYFFDRKRPNVFRFATTTPYLGFLRIAVYVYLILRSSFRCFRAFSLDWPRCQIHRWKNPFSALLLGCLSRNYNAS